MVQPSPRMDEQQFTAVAATCRWSERGLAVVRAILVDGVVLADAAARHDMTSKHARTLLTRFQEKAERLRLEPFLRKEQPKAVASPLLRFANDLRTLRDKGYSIEQVVAYLQENGVTTSATKVRNFLRSNRA